MEPGGLELRNGQQAVAQAARTELDLEPPTVSYEDAVRAARPAENHPFPMCFVCGPERADGLRILPGPVAGRELIAAPWTPGLDLAVAREVPSTIRLGRPGLPGRPGLARRGRGTTIRSWTASREARRTRCGRRALRRIGLADRSRRPQALLQDGTDARVGPCLRGWNGDLVLDGELTTHGSAYPHRDPHRDAVRERLRGSAFASMVQW